MKKTKRANAGSRASQPTHSKDGVDVTLIRWMLAMTPTQRLQTLQSLVAFVTKVRADNKLS